MEPAHGTGTRQPVSPFILPGAMARGWQLIEQAMKALAKVSESKTAAKRRRRPGGLVPRPPGASVERIFSLSLVLVPRPGPSS